MPRLSKIGAAALAAFGWTSGAAGVTASYLVVAGGAGASGNASGGGGAGGLREGTTSLNPTLSYSITVGAGGAGAIAGTRGNNGSDSIFSTITSTGGGAGGIGNTAPDRDGTAGGSGGGGSYNGGTGGAGNTPSTSPSQGNAGGTGTGNAINNTAGGGGGGAGSVGGNAPSSTVGGAGGSGALSSITGSSLSYAGGGGAGSWNGTGGAGGSGVGGAGTGDSTTGGNGVANRGGGAGSGGYSSSNSSGGNGGSGVVIISYPGAQQFGGGVVTSVGGNTIHTFTTSGTLSPLSSLSANYLIVAGGGGGGGHAAGGGGGAGGLLSGSSLTLDTNSIYAVTVGAGGVGGTTSSTNSATSGANSSFSTVSTSAVGGGFGGGGNPGNGGATGGSGGGGGGFTFTAGSGTAGQGNNGGTGVNRLGAGGGGAGAAGSNAVVNTNAGNGGNGSASSISGTSVTYAGGGGGGSHLNFTNGSGGTGGGGTGGAYSASGDGGNGTANLGGGGGGAGGRDGINAAAGGNGGSGIVIISYPGSTPQMAGGTVTAAGGNIIHTFTSSGYLTPITNLNNSLRFRSSASAYLNRTPTSAGNRKTWTFSTWVKLGEIAASNGTIFAAGTASGETTRFYLRYTGSQFQTGYGSQNLDTTSAVYRDPSAWYHLVLAVDTTQATAANRLKIYVNGVQQAVSTSVNYTQNVDTAVNNSVTHSIARDHIIPGGYFDGYLTDTYLIDGQALTPSSFGAFNGQGVWQPVRYGGSYGTNGFYLPFNGSSNSTFAGSFNGSNQSLTVPTSSQFSFSGDFTWEAWVLLNVVPSGGGASSIITSRGLVASDSAFQFLITDNSGQKNFGATLSIGSTDYNDFFPITPFTLTAGTWNHYAYVRSGSTVTAYFNGVAIGSATGRSGTTNTPSVAPSIGVRGGSYNDLYLNGYISNLRMVGSAVYTGNFTPPTSALTAISGTRLLTLQNSTIIDNSPNAFSITNNNGVTTSTQYPYVVTAFLDQGPVGNNWTPNNISGLNGSTYDFMRDVPTNTSATVANYCVLNPLDFTTVGTISEANLRFTQTSTGARSGRATIGVSSGKWYWEVTNLGGNNSPGIGNASMSLGTYCGGDANGWSYFIDGNKYNNNGATAYGASYTTNDIIGVALDMDAGTLVFYKNGVSQGTAFSSLTGTMFPAFSSSGVSNVTFVANFGQRPFAYTPPSGFVALNTFNLPTPTIGATPATTANKYFDISLWTGNGTSQNITNSGGFQPDFVWYKGRNTTFNNALFDAIRGVLKTLYSNTVGSESTSLGTLTAFNSNGFSVGDDAGANQNTSTYVGWQWNGGGSNATNTSGSITSTVRANTTSGFSIVTYTGTGANATVGHGLGVAPRMILLKQRNGSTYAWNSYHASLGNTYYIQLNTASAADNSVDLWNSTTPTTTVFSLSGSVMNINGGTYVAYCFAPIAGYSAFGSYTGNGSTDGPFVFTGFRPKFVMFKRTDSSGSWHIFDSSINTYNAATQNLYPNGTNTETANNTQDLLSNGFKCRSTDTDTNASGGTYIYAAFAESPFKYANAR